MFKLARYTTVVAALLASSSAIAADSGWKISEANGSVTVTRDGKQLRGQEGRALEQGDVVRTGKSSRAVLVRGREYLVVSPQAHIKIAEPEKAGAVTQIFQYLGNVLFKIEKKSTPHFGVETPYMAAVVKGTTFNVAVSQQGTNVQVTEGAVEVITNDDLRSALLTPGLIGMVSADDADDLIVIVNDEEAAAAARQNARGAPEFVSQLRGGPNGRPQNDVVSGQDDGADFQDQSDEFVTQDGGQIVQVSASGDEGAESDFADDGEEAPIIITQEDDPSGDDGAPAGDEIVTDDDGNNGHGNDPDGKDDSNPGQGGGNQGGDGQASGDTGIGGSDDGANGAGGEEERVVGDDLTVGDYDDNAGAPDSGDNLDDGGTVVSPPDGPGNDDIVSDDNDAPGFGLGDQAADQPDSLVGDDGNNGHGNDPDGNDDSNPGNGLGLGLGVGVGADNDDNSIDVGVDIGVGGDRDDANDDGNNGHGNDPDGQDDSNPGNKNGQGNGGGQGNGLGLGLGLAPGQDDGDSVDLGLTLGLGGDDEDGDGEGEGENGQGNGNNEGNRGNGNRGNGEGRGNLPAE